MTVPDNVLDLPLEEAPRFWDVRVSEANLQDIVAVEIQEDHALTPKVWIFDSFLLLDDGSKQVVWTVDGEYRRMKLMPKLADDLQWANLLGRQRIKRLEDSIKETREMRGSRGQGRP